MASDIEVSARREVRVEADPDRVFARLADVPWSASHYPKVKKLVDLGDRAYRWEMQEIGISGFSHQVVYACRYEPDERSRTIRWTPVPDVGNGQVSGSWRLAPEGTGTRLVFEARGALSIPVPWLLRSLVGPFVDKEFNDQIEAYLGNVARALDGGGA